MVLVQHGNERAFEFLYARHSRLALGVAQRVCHEGGDAADAVQEGFVSVWCQRAAYDRSKGRFRPWLLSVVHNRAVDAVRHDRVHAPAGESTDLVQLNLPGPDSTPKQVLHAERAATVRDAIGALPEPQRETIELTFYAGLSHSQVAERLVLPTGTVKGRVRLGLLKLRTLLPEREHTDLDLAA
jgi:RNA polymerase sigma-70 factor (ECF subfamily)